MEEMNEKPKLKQKQKVLNYILKYGSITPVDAIKDLGVYRLAARIWELIREDGYPIIKKMESAKNRDGETVWYARYSMA